MSYTLASVAPQIAALLNDPSQSKFSNTILLPYAKLACDELQLEFELYGILALEKKTSNPIVISQGWTDMSSHSVLPVDMLEPQTLEERLSGTSDLFMPMVARMWEPNVKPTDSLRYWSYREQNIFFIGATTDRDIMIKYLKSAVVIASDTTPITLNNSQQFFQYRTAALASRFVGENPTRADQLDGMAQTMLQKVMGIGVKNKQRTRTRRRPFVLTGRRRWL